jgi:pullulanase/glycogen debranching enzyme
MRNMMVALMVSQGTPMMVMGESLLCSVLPLFFSHHRKYQASGMCVACIFFTLFFTQRSIPPPWPSRAFILCFRHQCQRNLITHHLPFCFAIRCAGDELAKTHNGNNNWYGHNADWTFMNWDLNDAQQGLLRFCSELIKFRRGHPALAREEFVRSVLVAGADWCRLITRGKTVAPACRIPFNVVGNDLLPL